MVADEGERYLNEVSLKFLRFEPTGEYFICGDTSSVATFERFHSIKRVGRYHT